MLKTQTGIDGWDQWGIVTLLEENLNCYVLHIYIKCFCGWWTDSPLCAGQHHGTPAASSVPSHPHTISLNLWIRNDKLCSQTVYHRDNPVIIEQYVMERRIGKEERDKSHTIPTGSPTISFNVKKGEGAKLWNYELDGEEKQYLLNHYLHPIHKKLSE